VPPTAQIESLVDRKPSRQFIDHHFIKLMPGPMPCYHGTALRASSAAITSALASKRNFLVSAFSFPPSSRLVMNVFQCTGLHTSLVL
jgi:hypothetical protein